MLNEDRVPKTDRPTESYALTAEDQLWLIGKLAEGDARIARRAAYVLGMSPSRSEGAAAALFMGMTLDRYKSVKHVFIWSLGEMGETGRPFLVRVIRGPMMDDLSMRLSLMKAYASNLGVTLTQIRGHASDYAALVWWREHGQALLEQDPPYGEERKYDVGW